MIEKKKIKKISILTGMLVSLLLWTGFPGIIKETKMQASASVPSYFVTSSQVVGIIPIAVCSSPGAAACTTCAGPFNQIIYATSMGRNVNSLDYFCRSESFIAYCGNPALNSPYTARFMEISSVCMGTTASDRDLTNLTGPVKMQCCFQPK